MKAKLDSMVLGILLGIVSPFIAFLGYYLINYRYMTADGFIRYLALGKVYTPLITLCVLANFMVFFIFISKDAYKTSRGILFSTFLYAGFIVYLKLFT